MRDHFVLLVDQLLTESTIEAAIERNNQSQQATTSEEKDSTSIFSSQIMEFSSDKIANNTCSPLSKLVECRICHGEDEESNMEVPCSCCGSLKYAHRRCVQRWCDEKGDTSCEICRKQFRPGYTAPPPLPPYSGNFSGNWEIYRRDLNNPQFIAMVTGEHEFLDSSFDEYSAPSSRSLLCCRVVAITFLVLLVLRHTLPIMISGAGEYSLTLYMLLMLRTVGILLPICIMVKAFTAIQRRRFQQMNFIALGLFYELFANSVLLVVLEKDQFLLFPPEVPTFDLRNSNAALDEESDLPQPQNSRARSTHVQ